MNGSNINNTERHETEHQQQQQQHSTSGSRTIIKYEKSSCLFCNEWFDSQTFTVSTLKNKKTKISLIIFHKCFENVCDIRKIFFLSFY